MPTKQEQELEDVGLELMKVMDRAEKRYPGQLLVIDPITRRVVVRSTKPEEIHARTMALYEKDSKRVFLFGGSLHTSKGMSEKKIREAIETYRAKFTELGVEKKDYPHDRLLRSKVRGLGHCYGMLDKMIVFLRQGRREKVMRWLGFIQGVMWAFGQYTMDELKDHNRSDESKKVKTTSA